MSELLIGLTGGVASGKSTVSRYFAEMGVPTIDTDQVASNLVRPGSFTLTQIQHHFGQAAIQKDGSLNRAYLRQCLMASSADKLWLESLLHPLIRQAVETQAKACKAKACLIAIPLLKNREHYPYLNKIISVLTDESNQLQRLCQRDGLSLEEAKRWIALQPNRQHYQQLADDIIENTGNMDKLKAAVWQLANKYQLLK